MSNNVFDFFMNAMETEECQVPVKSVPDEYERASKKAESCYEKVKEVLSPEMQKVLLELEGEWSYMEAIGNGLYYRKGFSDALRLIFQALFWEPRKS